MTEDPVTYRDVNMRFNLQNKLGTSGLWIGNQTGADVTATLRV